MRNDVFQELKKNIIDSSIFRLTLSNAYVKFGIDSVLMDKFLSIFIDNSHGCIGDVVDQLKFIVNAKKLNLQNKLASYFESSNIKTAQLLLPLIVDSKIIGDIGAGRGMLAYKLLEHNPDLKIILADISQKYLSVEMSTNIEFRLISEEKNLPFKSGEVDLILIIDMLHHSLPHIPELIAQESARVLKPKGKLILIENSYLLNNDQNQLDDLATDDYFFGLSPRQKWLAYAFTEFFGHKIITQTDMPLEFNFKHLEAWATVFEEQGFKTLICKHLDIVPHKFHQLPKGLLISQLTDKYL